jgi:dCMP deaminase
MCPCTHAESNAIDNAAREGVSVRGAIMYCTTKPCLFCMGRIVNAGIVEVVYRDDYPHVLASEVAHYGKLSLRRYNVGEQ